MHHPSLQDYQVDIDAFGMTQVGMIVGYLL